MKKVLILIAVATMSVRCMAQEQLSFPYEGGKEAMTQFFRDSLLVSQDIIQKKAIGTAIFKFTADQKGRISKIIAYFADDYILVTPIIDALKKTDRKWIIPDHEKTHDFIIPFTFIFNPPAAESGDLQKTVYDNYFNRKPLFSADQVPLNETTLLPVVVINYDITQ